MATAKRVPQMAKYERVETPSVVQYWKVLTTNGVETQRDAMSPPVTNTFVSQKRIPQPDRIVLEMSVEEAYILLHYDWLNPRLNGTKETASAQHLANVLHDVLSPNAGTQTSPAKDAGCGVPDRTYKSRYHEAQENP